MADEKITTFDKTNQQIKKAVKKNKNVFTYMESTCNLNLNLMDT